MKKLYLILPVFFCAINAFPQQAQDYFPSEPGYKWNYRVTPLDSLNNELNELAFYRMDSSAFIADYEGREAYHILSKTGSSEVIHSLPYTDTLYINLSGSEGYEYFNLARMSAIITALDSAGLTIDSSLLSIFNSLQGWYSVYRFAEQVNQSYIVFIKDTTLIIDGYELQTRFEYSGIRLNDEVIDTEIGTFTSKKFVIAIRVLYRLFPPLPYTELVKIPDTLWIAPDHWIVKSFIPSTEIDLTVFGLGSYIIPGSNTEAISEVTDAEDDVYNLPLALALKQNYPNPFNPSTKINFSLNNSGLVILKVYNILGNEIDVLVNEELIPGEYNISFDGTGLASGVYFYSLIFSDKSGKNFTETKQMLLIK
jgi:hypothetical protein